MIFLQPATTPSIKKGMTIASMVISKPMAWDTIRGLSSVTVAIMMVGVPTGPKGTGGVLATRQITAAGRAGNPKPISMAAATATGAPCPDTPSMNAEKQKATNSACSLRSVDNEEM